MKYQIKELKRRSEKREGLLEQIVKTNNPIDNFIDPNNYLVLAREWNSWYPSTFQISGGCYFFNLNGEIIIIDPGFNTLEKIIEHHLDIRLIRHIFVTHFHPDHFISLSKLITRLPSEEHKISVYLNSTSFNQFKIYSRDNTEFYELIPGNNLTLDTNENDSYFKIEVNVTKAFHQEIGGNMNSIGLKFKLTYNQDDKKTYIIGFMSDTDGHSNYIQYYKKTYEKCDILIPHLGSIHSKPKGYKHLYLEGIEKLLKNLKDKNDRVIFLGEFGLELASNLTFYEGLTHLVSSKIPYMRLTKNIFKILYSEPPIGSSFYNNPIVFLLRDRFESIINKIKDKAFLKLEVLLPFILFNESSLGWEREDEYKRLFNELEDKIELFLKMAYETKFKQVWWSILQKFAFEADETDEYKIKLINFMDELGLTELRKNMDENCKLFVPFFINELKDKLNLLEIIPTEGNLFSDIDLLLPRGIELEVNNFSTPIYDGIINFYGLDKPLKTFFNNKEIFENPKFKWFIFILSIYFFIKVSEVHESKELNELPDGRGLVCKYLRDKTNKLILPVHDSYKILFKKSGIECEGHCTCYNRTIVPLLNVNPEWEFNVRKEEPPKSIGKKHIYKEFINVIPDSCCEACAIASKEPDPYEIEYLEERNRIQEEAIREDEEGVIKSYEDKIKTITNLRELFYFYSEDLRNVIFWINPEILKEKVSELIEKTDLNSQEIILYLIHPKLIKSPVIREFIELQLKELTQDGIIHLIYEIFNNPLPYKEIEQEPVYLYLFINTEFCKLIISKIENKINLEFLIKAVKYLNDLREYRKDLIKWNAFYKFIRTKAINILYPLIENPNDFKSKYELLKNHEDFTIHLENLGPPFVIYANFFNSNLGYRWLTPKFIKLLFGNSKLPKYRFLWF